MSFRRDDAFFIINPSPERLKLTQVEPGIYVAKDAYAPPMPGEEVDYFASSPLFDESGKVVKTK